jgi:ABC-type multidrug transport system ATPase subunit
VLAGGRLIAEGTPAELRAPGARLRIEVDDAPRAASLLAELPRVGVEAGGDGSLRVTLDGFDPAEVNRLLVTHGVAVRALVPERRSLEEVFMALIEPQG